ncbi:defective proboscis extension response [Culex quinquefasciatus]|uniref:Defective proboscis extension response n=1 Tax=Culex quinquefasciatus TaxID=7176 RepID=B0X4M5_CULQU|nr:hemicentin-2 isoform X2 [Culex quinquefasciatus]EDS40442.1 defective proboscis extension response [Culex quinquefasciatus]|eukprot:XP_001864597.1 defective proboscis extension response [Culex quinquefasciatus]
MKSHKTGGPKKQSSPFELPGLCRILYPMVLLSVYLVDLVGQVEASSAAVVAVAATAPEQRQQPQQHTGVSFSARVEQHNSNRKEAGAMKGITPPPGGPAGVAGAADDAEDTPYTAAILGTDNKPYFDDVSPRNVTTVVDDMAVLKCRVKHKGNRTVSWMRKKDLHILTSSTHTYTGDQRFSVHHPPDSDDWDLRISYAQPRDSGIYECQVNTEPKINLAVFLHVTAARAKILGSQEAHVRKGSTISLSCVVNFHAPSITWYHGTSVVNFDSARGGISLETEKTEAGTSSRLLLTKATVSDSGNYTCVPAGAIPASVQVYVINGEHPAAMQTSGQRSTGSEQLLLMLLVTLALLLNQSLPGYSTLPQRRRRPGIEIPARTMTMMVSEQQQQSLFCR